MHVADLEAARGRHVVVRDVPDLLPAWIVFEASLRCDDQEHRDRMIRGFFEDRANRKLCAHIGFFFPEVLERLTDVRPAASWHYHEHHDEHSDWSAWTYTVSYTIPDEWMPVHFTGLPSTERRASP